jgi:hypothetical protein
MTVTMPGTIDGRMNAVLYQYRDRSPPRLNTRRAARSGKVVVLRTFVASRITMFLNPYRKYSSWRIRA